MTMTRGTTGSKGGAIASATPYPWPYHGSFQPGQCALVACLDPLWRVGANASQEIDSRLSAMAQQLRQQGGFVVAVTLLPPRRPDIDPSRGRTAPSERRPYLFESDVALHAGGTSAFFGSELDQTLRRAHRRDLVVAGWGLEGPVHSTLRDANDRGYECLLVADASTSLASGGDQGLASSACSMVRFSGGIFGAVASTAEFLALLDNEEVS
jgi:nicotinamidase-related amidase